jgi:hypothetical protein
VRPRELAQRSSHAALRGGLLAAKGCRGRKRRLAGRTILLSSARPARCKRGEHSFLQPSGVLGRADARRPEVSRRWLATCVPAALRSWNVCSPSHRAAATPTLIVDLETERSRRAAPRPRSPHPPSITTSASRISPRLNDALALRAPRGTNIDADTGSASRSPRAPQHAVRARRHDASHPVGPLAPGVAPNAQHHPGTRSRAGQSAPHRRRPGNAADVTAHPPAGTPTRPRRPRELQPVELQPLLPEGCSIPVVTSTPPRRQHHTAGASPNTRSSRVNV